MSVITKYASIKLTSYKYNFLIANAAQFSRWIKTGNVHNFVFIGKEVIATTSGNHIIFFNLITREETIEYFKNSKKRNEGVSCLAGHPVIKNIFLFILYSSFVVKTFFYRNLTFFQ